MEIPLPFPSGHHRPPQPTLRLTPLSTPEPKTPVVTVGDFYARHSEALALSLVGEQVGFERKIREPTINRPGLALAGFYSYFADRRIQVLGAAELSYLRSLTPHESRQ